MGRTEMGDVVGLVRHENTPGYWDALPLLGKVFLRLDLHNKESVYQYLDNESRRRGYLVKQYNVSDLKYMTSMTYMCMKAYKLGLMEKMGESSKLSSFLHPQLEAQSIICGCPNISWLLAMTRNAMSESSMEKICVQDATPHDSIDDLRLDFPIGTVNATPDVFWVLKYFSEQPLGNLSEIRGGSVERS